MHMINRLHHHHRVCFSFLSQVPLVLFFFYSFSNFFRTFLSPFASSLSIVLSSFATFISDFAVSLKTLKSSLNCFLMSLYFSLIVFNTILQSAFTFARFSGVALLIFSLHAFNAFIVSSRCCLKITL